MPSGASSSGTSRLETCASSLRAGVDQQQLLLDAEGEGRRSAEEMVHRVGIIGSAAPMNPRKTLHDELRSHALIVGEVTLTSGRTAQYYVDAKRAILRPAGFRALAELVAGTPRGCARPPSAGSRWAPTRRLARRSRAAPR